jgi:predicted transcriptional regulator
MADVNPFQTDKINEHLKDAKNTSGGTETDLLKNITSASKRLKIIEDRYLTIRKKTQITDQNMLETSSKFNDEIRSINDELTKLKITMKDMNEKIDQMISEMKGLAKQQDLLTLSKYVDFWKQFNFVTKEQLEREIKYRTQE